MAKNIRQTEFSLTATKPEEALRYVRYNALGAAQRAEYLGALAATADMLDMGFAYVETPTGFRAIGSSDTPQSLVNFAGLENHLGITHDRILDITLSRGWDPELLEDYESIQYYLDGVGSDSDDTPLGQFETSIIDRIPDGVRIQGQPVSVIAEIIESLQEGGGNR